MSRNALSLTVSWADSHRPNGRTVNIYSSSIFLSLKIFDLFFLSFEKCEMSKINIRMQRENKWSCLWINICCCVASVCAYQFGGYWNEITLTVEHKFNNLNVCCAMKMEKRNKNTEKHTQRNDVKYRVCVYWHLFAAMDACGFFGR